MYKRLITKVIAQVKGVFIKFGNPNFDAVTVSRRVRQNGCTHEENSDARKQKFEPIVFHCLENIKFLNVKMLKILRGPLMSDFRCRILDLCCLSTKIVMFNF